MSSEQPQHFDIGMLTVYSEYFARRKGTGAYILQGGRRSGKTFAVCLRLIALCAKHQRIVNIATMTQEQGRLGAYADCCTIINAVEGFKAMTDIRTTPREIRFTNGSRIFFNSYANSETAKGVACDYVFLNEANNFSEQHYIDLLANARRGVYIDFNPNGEFWVTKYYRPEDILVTTWRDNRFLTDAQRAYFAKLKELGTAENASAVNVRNYRVYYLGEYSELTGEIYTPDCFDYVPPEPKGLKALTVFCDPSALRGSDWFACVLAGYDAQTERVVFVDMWSVNEGTRAEVVQRLRQWCASWDIDSVIIETNGIIGIDFYEFAMNSGLPVQAWTSRGNKFDRIVAAYGNLTERAAVCDTPQNRAYLQQVYTFAPKCEHDDNIDAMVSAYTATICRAL